MLQLIEKTLDEVLPAVGERPEVLSAAVRWAVEGGGKRIRPQICLAAATAVGGPVEDARYPAAAIELLHSYTLVHDDLPCMDNDVERRGKASVWAKFGEANGVLAADALQALAFATAARAPRNAAAVVAELARAGSGVVAGQVEDLVLQADRSDVSRVAFVYEHKTADLFMASACMGALAAGATPEQVAALRTYGLHLGLAFQHEDDLLDGDSPFDAAETARRVLLHTKAAVEALAALPGDTTFLSSLATRLVGRTA